MFAAVIEVVGFVTLATFALRPYRYYLAPASSPFYRTSFFNPRLVVRVARWVALVVALQAVVASAILLAMNSPVTTSSGASSVVVKVVRIHGVSVLTNAHGFTLYWFAPDTMTTSKCNGSCAAYWPPVIGKMTAAAGVSLPGKFGTIKRADGQLQATYDGHPLYTYKGDTAPGQANGNGSNASGGLWYAVTPSGAKPGASPSPSASSRGGGY